MADSQHPEWDSGSSLPVRPLPPRLERLPPQGAEHNGNNIRSPPTSPTTGRRLPETPLSPTRGRKDAVTDSPGPDTRAQSPPPPGVREEGARPTRPPPNPQRAMSPPAGRPYPVPPNSNHPNRPLSPPPNRSATSNTPQKSEPPPLYVDLEYKPRSEADSSISSRLGPVPTASAPAPGTSRPSTPPLPETLSPSIQRSASSSVSRTLDLDPSVQLKSNKSSSLLGFLGKPGQSGARKDSTAPVYVPGSDGGSLPPEYEKLRVHFKHLLDAPDTHFTRTPVDFKPASHRDRVAFEFYTSELSYNNYLRVIIDIYKTPLVNAQKAGHLQIKEDDAQKSFGPIESVLAVSDILLEALTEKIRNWDSNTQTIGAAFVQYGDLLKVYATFAREQQNAKLAQAACSSSKTYNFLLKLSQQHPASQQQSLSSLMIMPIQRIPRYELLLRDLIKVTDATHPDLPNLNQALTKVKSVAEQVDRSVEEYKQLEKLLAIQSSFSVGSVNLVKPGRRFVKEGALVKVCRRANKTRKFWLFNDILLYGIPILGGSNVVSGEFNLAQLQLQDIQDGSDYSFATLPASNSPLNSSSSTISNQPAAPSPQTPQKDASNREQRLLYQFMIQTRSKSFVVFASTQQEKADWMVAIMNAVAERKSAANTLQTGGNANALADVAPAWVPDAQAPNCTVCTKEFGLTKRRHHCRQCGLVVCDDCSKGRVVLPGVDKHAVRICDSCIIKQTNKPIATLSSSSSARSLASPAPSTTTTESSS